MRRAFGTGAERHTGRKMLLAILGVSSLVGLGLLALEPASAQPGVLSPPGTAARLVQKVESLPELPDQRMGGYPGFPGEFGDYRNAVCPPNRPYYKPYAYQRYWRHRFRPLRDYYPFDPPARCASWPWSTHVCVGAYVAPHPVPVGIDCVR